MLAQRPSLRVKRMRNDRIAVVRRAEPVLHQDRNVVDVNYAIEIGDSAGAPVETIAERHALRYLFMPELESVLGAAGLR